MTVAKSFHIICVGDQKKMFGHFYVSKSFGGSTSKSLNLWTKMKKNYFQIPMQMVETTSVNPIQQQKFMKVGSIRITDNIFFCIATKMVGQNSSNEIVDIKSKKWLSKLMPTVPVR